MTVPIQNLRSNVSSKRPTATGLSFGQIAVNYNEDDPAIYLRGDGNALVKVSPTFVGATQPNITPGSGGSTGNSKGESWLDTSVSPPLLKIYDGSTWVSAGGAGGGATGSGGDEIVLEFDQTVTTSYTVASGKNALTVGPLEIASGVTLTVPSGSRLLVL
tara:strand:+ start:3898 stop:4377 length:480 start_codon:yes stop_codon:yes gene_type:complete